jgi:hypothetical protein
MSLVMNTRNHWQLPDGGELHSGDLIEVYINDSWISGRIEYKPRREYVLVLDNGQVWDICEGLNLRWREPKVFL